MSDNSNLHDKEASFHDAWAAGTSLDDVPVRALFESPVAMENRWILQQMGDIRGKRLLDIGCGLGESSVYFALQGANVTACDISPGMVDFACKLATRHGVSIGRAVSGAEDLSWAPDGSFDLIYIANTIHHVHHRLDLYREMARVLVPGGCFFSWDPMAYNPVINRYRAMATDVRTPDESPLTMADIDEMKKVFGDIRWRTFWISSLALFLKYYFVDRVHPNEDRYWKRIFRPQSLWWWRPLAWTDQVILTQIPGLRLLAWNIGVCGAVNKTD